MTRCPCCRREINVRLVECYDDGDVYELEAVPLRDQPCTSVEVGSPHDVSPRPCDAYRGPGWRGIVCNWLCNVPSHVTPCDTFDWRVFRPVLQPFVVFGTRPGSMRLHAGLARCVQSGRS